MLKLFKNLKSLSLGFEFSRDEFVENEPAFVDDHPEMTLQPLDSLTFDIDFDEASAGDLELVKEILSSWPRIRRLSFDVDVYYAAFDNPELLETVSREFFGTQFLEKDSVPASWLLEEFEVRFRQVRWDEESESYYDPENDAPPTGIPCAALVPQDYLLNLKVLTLNCYLQLDSASFASIALSTPQLEQFRSHGGSCLGGLRSTDLLWNTFSNTFPLHTDLSLPPFVILGDKPFWKRLHAGLEYNWERIPTASRLCRCQLAPQIIFRSVIFKR